MCLISFFAHCSYFLQWCFERHWVEWKEIGFWAWQNSTDMILIAALSFISSVILDKFIFMFWDSSVKVRLITVTLQGLKINVCKITSSMLFTVIDNQKMLAIVLKIVFFSLFLIIQVVYPTITKPICLLWCLVFCSRKFFT